MIVIADSNITKRALAVALKELMNEMSFSKISISDICMKCDMNRKSFYYHFKDKYDLVNWIFDTEYLAITSKKVYRYRVDSLLDMSNYFYENQRFYRNALEVRGQNSFVEHFHEMLRVVALGRLKELFDNQEIPSLYVDWVVDSFVCAIIRWIREKNPIPPEQFTDMISNYVFTVATAICDIKQDREKTSK